MRILLGVSGGLDSSYSAEILKAEGYTVEGAVLKMHGFTDIDGARKASEKAGIKLHIIDCSAVFEEKVVSYFINEYSSGRTPNPCTVCNRSVKIEELIKYAESNGFDLVATGHYARTGEEKGRYFIADGADTKKNQSYMLWKLTQEQIKKLVFPLGDRIKEDVRNKAGKLGIESAGKSESQDICFLPNGGYAQFVKSRLGAFPEGDFIDVNGKILGRHKGIINYTVGQRKGLGIALGERMFVSNIDSENNTVTLKNACANGFVSAELTDMNYQLMEKKDGRYEVDVKIRYTAVPVPSVLTISGEKSRLDFNAPVKAVTPGQSAVMYRDGRILCGGVINKAFEN